MTPAIERPRISWEIGASLGLHLGLVGLLLLAETLSLPAAPLWKPDEIMVVQAVALPKSTTRMPQKAMHTPDPMTGQDAAADTVVPPTASDMVKIDELAEKTKGQKARTDEREALLNQARREELLRDMDSPLGPTDQTRTDPNGVDPEFAILGAGTGRIDPVLAKYIAEARAKILPNWAPLPALVASHPDYVVQILVKVGADGTMTDPEIYKGSPDSGFDASALRAIIKTGRLPSPPADYRESAEKGVLITLTAKDKT